MVITFIKIYFQGFLKNFEEKLGFSVENFVKHAVF
jgi:hypothetical protein